MASVMVVSPEHRDHVDYSTDMVLTIAGLLCRFCVCVVSASRAEMTSEKHSGGVEERRVVDRGRRRRAIEQPRLDSFGPAN